MSTIAIITARGGSKRIPKKNIRPFLGKPIIAYSIEAALKSGVFDEVMVSTDSQEIADMAIKYGAKVPFLRSEKNSDDYATTLDVIREVSLEYKKIGKEYEHYCCLYPTAPFVTPERLIEAFEKLQDPETESVFPVVPFSYPTHKSLKIENNKVAYCFPQYAEIRSQDRSQDTEKTFHDAGQFYFFKIASFLKNGRIMNENTSCIILSELEAQDIDSEIDWQIAEQKFQLKQKNEKKN
jgi:N-acylneuraminate cytidylyltransferase